MSAPAVAPAPWAVRRTRADALRDRYTFARGPLALFRALLDVQEPVWTAARSDAPAAAAVAAYAAERALPGVVQATSAAGPAPLVDLVRATVGGAAPDDRAAMIRRWLDGEDQTPVERYLARASAGPVLEALASRDGLRPAEESADGRRCPACGGLPQLSYFAAPVESLASGPRSLVCSRCATVWAYPRLTCAFCGETDTARLTILAEEGTEERSLSGSTVRGLRGREEAAAAAGRPRFPHMRIDACTACSRYLVSIDLGREPRAVPLVDELAAIPLDLHAQESGFTKVVPNLMGA
jgi:hypothetical protein